MPRLTIDGQHIEVEPGLKVIDAAQRLGIMIPRFCYHPALGSVGACRMCAVMFLEGPVEGLQMSCMIDAVDGMAVSTEHAKAVAFRRHVIEWLMMNHPHDCPVCDEGGHCLLQDLTVSGGHTIRRFPGKKRTYRDQYLGPLVEHEMNRCIHCYRCSRFYREYAGYRDLGTLQIASSLYFGRYCDGILESPFSGNLIDLCPTGVYTDKPSRYKARRWDLERSDSICIHCSLGCSTKPGARYRSVIRTEARLNEAVNGHFICDRGRYGFEYAAHPARPRTPRTDGTSCSMEEAMSAAARSIAEVQSRYGSQAVACLTSPRAGLETMAGLKRLARLSGWRPPVFFSSRKEELAARQAAAVRDPEAAISMSDVGGSDFLLAVGLDPVNEAPMLALAMRQAARRGATVAVIDPRPVELPFAFRHVPTPRRGLSACLGALVKQSLGESDLSSCSPEMRRLLDSLPQEAAEGTDRAELDRLASLLAACHKPIFLAGPEAVDEATPSLAADCTALFRELGRQGGFFPVLSGANAYGAALMSDSPGRSLEELLKEAEHGNVKALLVVEADPLAVFPDREGLERLLSSLDLLLVLDYLPSETASRASMLLPVDTVFEAGSSYINQEGRLQYAAPVHAAGRPLSQVSGGGHPPRQFSRTAPGEGSGPSWRILHGLGEQLGLNQPLFSESPWELVASEAPRLGHLPASGYPYHNLKLGAGPSSEGGAQPYSLSGGQNDAPGLEVLLTELTFGTEELSAYSRTLAELSPEPFVIGNDLDAENMGLQEGALVRMRLPGGDLQSRLCVSARTAPGTLILPRLSGSGWQAAGRPDLRLAPEAIQHVDQGNGGAGS